MANVLVGYATRAGATKDVAEAIANGIGQAGHSVEVVDLKSPVDADGIDAVVVGSGIQAGVMYSEALDFLDRNATTLDGRPVAIFNVCMTASDPAQHEAALAYNKAAVGRAGNVVAQAAFAGRYVPAKVSWWKRWLLKGLNKSAQDNVDATKAQAWGREVAGLI